MHRSQGSEYPAVVVPLTMSAYTLLQRNLLYTAVTRAKRLVVLAGSRKALAIAVRTAGTGRRHTALTHRLQHPSATRPCLSLRPYEPPATTGSRAAPARASTRSCPHPPITGDTMARASLRALEGAYGAPAGPSAWRRSARLQVPPQLRPGICWLLSRRSCGTRSPPRSERDLCSTRDAR